jgi:hypothetical protein
MDGGTSTSLFSDSRMSQGGTGSTPATKEVPPKNWSQCFDHFELKATIKLSKFTILD